MAAAAASSSSNSSSLVSSLRDEVICTTCLSLPRVGMYQCENGHLICKDCFARCLNVCPTCKKPMGKIRSIIADKILSLLPMPCQHSDHGCNAELYQTDLDVHEQVCPFRLTCCVDIACNAKVPFCKMLDHMSKDHEAGDFVHANDSKYQSYFIVNDDDFCREIMWISDHLTLDGLHFFRECCRSNEGQWHVWVYLLGCRAQADQFRATVRIFLPSEDQQGCEEEMIYRGRVNALDSPNRQKSTEVAGLTFPDFVARRFWRNRQIHYEVQVERRSGGNSDSGNSNSSKKEHKKSSKESNKKSNNSGSSKDNNNDSNSPSSKSEDKIRKKKSASTGGGQQNSSSSNSSSSKKEDVKETSC